MPPKTNFHVYVPTVPIVGMGKDGRILAGPWGYLNRKLSFVELPWELLPLCRFSVVNAIGNAIAWPDKLGTSPMAYDGSNGNRSGKQGEVESRKLASDSTWVWRTSGLTRDGTAEPNSRDQTLRRERGLGKFPVSLFSCPQAGSATIPASWCPVCWRWWPHTHTTGNGNIITPPPLDSALDSELSSISRCLFAWL